jgi:hypothetical protein
MLETERRKTGIEVILIFAYLCYFWNNHLEQKKKVSYSGVVAFTGTQSYKKKTCDTLCYSNEHTLARIFLYNGTYVLWEKNPRFEKNGKKERR